MTNYLHQRNYAIYFRETGNKMMGIRITYSSNTTFGDEDEHKNRELVVMK